MQQLFNRSLYSWKKACGHDNCPKGNCGNQIVKRIDFIKSMEEKKSEHHSYSKTQLRTGKIKPSSADSHIKREKLAKCSSIKPEDILLSTKKTISSNKP